MPANPSYAQGFNGLKNTGAIMDVFATTVKESLYAKTFLPQITESGYLGQIKNKGQTVTIATVPRVKTFAYSRGMTLPINCESEPALELKVDRAMAWTQFWDRLDQHQTHLKMLQPETIAGAASQIAEDMEKEFLSEVATFAHAKNVGTAAGIQSGAYNLGTAAAPVGVKADRILDPGEAVERVERRLRVQNHPSLGVDAGASCGAQVVDILLLDAVAAQLALDRRDIAQQAARREADPDVVDV